MPDIQLVISLGTIIAAVTAVIVANKVFTKSLDKALTEFKISTSSAINDLKNTTNGSINELKAEVRREIEHFDRRHEDITGRVIVLEVWRDERDREVREARRDRRARHITDSGVRNRPGVGGDDDLDGED